MSDLALVFDQTDRESFWKAVATLPKHPKLILKLGLRLLPLLSKEDFVKLRAEGFRLFIDVKLHDIPSQVADAVTTWGALGASYVTVHLSGGRDMLSAAAKAADECGVTLLGVSILTSMDQKDISEVGFNSTVEVQVNKLTKLGWESGLKAFVCSPFEIESVLKQLPGALLVTPGISIDEDMTGMGTDQKRRRTFKEALAAGSSMPVVGRALWNLSEGFDRELNNLLEQLT